MAKIRYIEINPFPQKIDFEDNEKYKNFINKRINEIIDFTYLHNMNFYDYFKYERILLNKNGEPRKLVNPTSWILSNKSKKKQKENFGKYCEDKRNKRLQFLNERKKIEIKARLEFYNKQLEELENENVFK